MNNWGLDLFIGCTTAVVIVLGVVAAIYFGMLDNNQKYYASMEKCIAAAGTFVPMRGGEAFCFMGNKQ